MPVLVGELRVHDREDDLAELAHRAGREEHRLGRKIVLEHLVRRVPRKELNECLSKSEVGKPAQKKTKNSKWVNSAEESVKATGLTLNVGHSSRMRLGMRKRKVALKNGAQRFNTAAGEYEGQKHGDAQ